MSGFLVAFGVLGGGVIDRRLRERIGDGVCGMVEVKYAGSSSPSESESCGGLVSFLSLRRIIISGQEQHTSPRRESL